MSCRCRFFLPEYSGNRVPQQLDHYEGLTPPTSASTLGTKPNVQIQAESSPTEAAPHPNHTQPPRSATHALLSRKSRSKAYKVTKPPTVIIVRLYQCRPVPASRFARRRDLRFCMTVESLTPMRPSLLNLPERLPPRIFCVPPLLSFP